ncbi:MAG: ferrous iron transport protein A [Gemmatimonadetes bacterium]|nr:ferrous iron transport protein A [Gemmatimonadota bacterium]
MTPIERLRNGLRGLQGRAWGETCPDGNPVPEASRCAAVDCDSIPLTALKPGETGTVTCLQEPGTLETGKLAAMGVLPGSAVELRQRYPAFVFRMGHSEFAVDRELASRIRVRRE